MKDFTEIQKEFTQIQAKEVYLQDSVEGLLEAPTVGKVDLQIRIGC